MALYELVVHAPLCLEINKIIPHPRVKVLLFPAPSFLPPHAPPVWGSPPPPRDGLDRLYALVRPCTLSRMGFTPSAP